MFPLPLIVVVAAIVWAFHRHPDPRFRFRLLKRVAFVLMLAFGGFVALFVGGETLTDPGGWVGIGWVAAWAVPLAGLAVFAWRRPDQATPTFVALVGALLALTLWYLASTDSWDSFEDRHGPVRTIVAFALLAALAFLAWHRPLAGGALMLVVALVPGFITVALHGAGQSAVVAVGGVPTVAALLFLWSARYGADRARPRPRARHP